MTGSGVKGVDVGFLFKLAVKVAAIEKRTRRKSFISKQLNLLTDAREVIMELYLIFALDPREPVLGAPRPMLLV